MFDRGYTQGQIADAIGVSTTALMDALALSGWQQKEGGD